MTPATRVLYVLICGVSEAPTSYDFITELIADGWDVCAIPTPTATRFIDTQQYVTLTGHPVRSTYKDPSDPDVLPPADAFVVAPASFNTVNKLANGISDTLPVGIVCEAIGNQRPVIVAPWLNRALARHLAYKRSIRDLRENGVRLVLTERTEPGGSLADPGGRFPWDAVLAEVRNLQNPA